MAAIGLIVTLALACDSATEPASPDAPLADAASCVPVDDNNPCTADVCIDDVPAHDVMVGAACPMGGVCDATGACVLPSCTDGAANGTETDVDCGGGCAPISTCAPGQACTTAADCTSGVCGADMRCASPACGDGVAQPGEMCDDGNMTDGDGCDDGADGRCRPTGCGNGVTAGAEACDDGNAVNGDGCDNNCTVSACGNAVTAGSEACDDANLVSTDGCSAVCTVEPGWRCTATVPSMCTPACGDGVVIAGEGCDDGNLTSGDGCDSNCTVSACGNGVVAGAETCDDGNSQSLDGCSSTCATDIVAIAEREPNEDGATSVGTVNGGNDFDSGGIAVANATAQGVIRASSGDTVVAASLFPAGDEDVFAVANDTSLTSVLRLDTWSLAEGFGLGVVCRNTNVWFRVRDAAGTSLATGTRRNTRSDWCGGRTWVMSPGATVYIHVSQLADDRVVPRYALQLDFTPLVCGDGMLHAGLEECDDGNALDGDGCSATCAVQGMNEREPNEDGTPSPGGSGFDGNDFDIGGTRAIMNAALQGIHDVATGRRIWIGTLQVGPAPGTGGDEDVYAVTNAGPAPFDVYADAYLATTGFGKPCDSNADVAITVRLSSGVALTRNIRRVTGDGCGHVTFVLAAGETRYVHVTQWNDNAVLPRYFLAVEPHAIVCGDGVLAATAESCDDGNTIGGDGCSALCGVEAIAEIEPNEDGTPASGGIGPDGNDFDVGGMLAVGNATAQGVHDLAGGARIWSGRLGIGPLPGAPGDEDVYVVANSGSAPLAVTAATYMAETGFGHRCSTSTPPPNESLEIKIRDGSGLVVATGLDRAAGDHCGEVRFAVPAGQRRYVHLVEWDDDNATAAYFLSVVPSPVVCGDGDIVAGVEACDDGNAISGDGCSSTCVVEPPFFCGGAPSSCWRPPTPVPLACTDMIGATVLVASGDEAISPGTGFPFPARLYGISYIHVVASTNGFVQPLTNAMETPYNPWPGNPTTVPDSFNPFVGAHLAPFWDNLVLTGAGLLAKTTGAAPDRIFTIEWNAATADAPIATGLRVQLQFREDGFIEYHYCAGGGDAGRASGNSATIGTQDPTRSFGFGYAINATNTVIPGSTALRWDLR